MALKVGELFTELRLESKAHDQGLQKSHGVLKNVKDQSERSERGIRNLGSAFQDMAKIAGGFILAKAFIELPQLLGRVSKGAADAASDLSEAQNKVNVVFGESAGVITEWAQTSSSALGISEEAALSAAGTYGNLLTTMGLTKPASAEMSMGIVTLASDLASFNNASPEEMLEKLRAGLVGEVEPLRAVGVNLNAVMVEAKAMEMGLADANGEVSEGAKVMARYALIQEQTANAQGDFARTSDGMANAGRIIKAAFTDLSTELGQRLLPLIEPLVVRFSQWLPAAIDDFAAAFDRIMRGASAFRDWVQGIFSSGDVLGTFLGNLPGWFDSMIQTVTSMMGIGGHNAIVAYAQGIIDGAASNVQTAINYVADLIASYLVGQSPPKKGPLSQIRRGGFNTMEAWVQGAIDGAVLVEGVADDVAGKLDDVGSKMELDAGRAGLEAATGNLEAMEAAAENTAGKIAEIDREMADLDLQIRDLGRQIEDINDEYDDQIEVLEEQKRIIQEQYDIQNERLRLENDIARAQIDQSRAAALGDPERRAEIQGEKTLLEIEEERAKVEADIAKEKAILNGEAQELTEAEREELELKQRSLELDKKEANEKLRTDKELTTNEKARLQLKIDQVDAQIAENNAKLAGEGTELTPEEREAHEMRLRGLELRKEELALIDETALAEADKDAAILDSRQKQLDIDEKIAEAERDIALIPIDEKIAKANEEREKALAPLEAQKALYVEQREDLDYLRQQWQFLAGDIDAALGPLQEAARLHEQMAKDAERQAKAAEAEAKAAERSAEAAAKKADAAARDNSFEARQARLAGTGAACLPGWIMDEFGNCINPAEEADKAAQKAKADAAKATTGAPVFDAQAAEDLIMGQAVAPPIVPVAPGGDVLSADMLGTKPEPFGARMGALFADGFINRIGEMIRQNMGKVLGASVGAAIGGGLASMVGLTPVGAAIGGLLGGFIGDGLQDELGKRDIDFSSIIEGLQEKFDEFDRFHRWLVGGQENVQGFGNTVRDIFDTYIAPALRRISDDLLPAFEQAWARIEPAIEPALRNVARLIEWVSDQIDIHWGSIMAVVEPIWNAVVRIVSDAVGQASRVIAAVLLVIAGDWQGAWTQVKGFLLTTWNLISDIVSNGVTLIQKFIDDALPVIYAKLLEWGAAFWDWVEPQIEPMLQELGKLLVKLGEWLIDTALPVLWDKLQEWGSAFIDWVGPKIPPLIAELERLSADLLNWVGGIAAPAIIEKLKIWAGAFLDWIKDEVLPYLVTRAGEILDDLGAWMDDTARPAIREKLKAWASAFLEWIMDDVVPYLRTKLGEITSDMFEWITDTALPGLKKKLLAWAGAFLDFIKDEVIPYIGGKLEDLITAIGAWVNENIQKAKDAVKDIGKAIVEGIWEGIKSLGDWFKGKVGEFIDDNVPDFISDRLQEQSPSRVMMPIGANAVRGLMAGAEGEGARLRETFANMASLMTEGANLASVNVGRIPSSRMAIPAAASASSSIVSDRSRHKGVEVAGDIIIPIYRDGREEERYIVNVMNRHARRVH